MQFLSFILSLLAVNAARAQTSCNNPSAQSLGSEWSGWGGNIYNNRWASNNTALTSSSAACLVQNCRFTYHLGVSATPTVFGDIVYYPTWSGVLVALNYKTCAVQWNISVADIITQFAPVSANQRKVIRLISRTSPQVDGNILYFGTQINALLVALDRSTGATLAVTQINSHPYAQLTMSPTVYNGRIFIGASSFEEVAVLQIPNYECCSFIGNMAALDFNRATNQFTVAWNVSMLPQGWAGGAVWGSQPSIDIARQQVFIGTGNVYLLPDIFQECIDQTANISVIAQGLGGADACIPPDVYQEAVIAFDIQTGLINWLRQLNAIDAWQLACGTIGGAVIRNTTLCPYTPGPDADFGMAPTFVPGSSSTPHGRDIVVIGQKNGEVHALSAQAGQPFWSTVTSPSGTGGGLIWGIAVDDTQVYFAGVNTGYQTFQLQPSGITVNNSVLGAASLHDGSLVWEIASPLNSISIVPPSVVNDVVFFGRSGQNLTGTYQTTQGGLVAVNKATGAIIRDYGLDTQFHGAVAIQDQYVMFGTGYNSDAVYNGTGSFVVLSAPSSCSQGASASQFSLTVAASSTRATASASSSSGASGASASSSSRASGASAASSLASAASSAASASASSSRSASGASSGASGASGATGGSALPTSAITLTACNSGSACNAGATAGGASSAASGASASSSPGAYGASASSSSRASSASASQSGGAGASQSSSARTSQSGGASATQSGNAGASQSSASASRLGSAGAGASQSNASASQSGGATGAASSGSRLVGQATDGQVTAATSAPAIYTGAASAKKPVAALLVGAVAVAALA